MSDYDYFMVYELDNSGERVRLDVLDQAELRNILDPEQVFVIVKEELRRIYIWKGAKSPVRKRFISSRIAQELQEELVKQAAFHRCKIISVDQGDEVSEFLNAFNLESMEVTEKLADMRYIRNVDREKMLEEGIIPEEGQKIIAVDKDGTEKAQSTTTEKSPTPKPPVKRYMPSPMRTTASVRTAPSMAEKEQKAIMEKIIKESIPDNMKRQNLIIGHSLYGAVSKKVKVFGKELEEIDWEPVTTVPKGMMQIDDRILRVYFDEERGTVEALEILETMDGEKTTLVKKVENKPEPKKTVEKEQLAAETKTAEKKEEINYSSWPVKALRNECIKKKIKIPVNARKTDLLQLLKDLESEEASPSITRRNLPSIPKA